MYRNGISFCKQDVDKVVNKKIVEDYEIALMTAFQKWMHDPETSLGDTVRKQLIEDRIA